MPKRARSPPMAKKRSRVAKRRTAVSGQRRSVAMGTMVPLTLKAVHRYNENVVFTPATATLSKYFFKTNGLYDPNTTGIGHQPLLFDQYGALFDHYTVYRSRIKVTFANGYTTQSNQAFNTLVGIYIDDDGTDSSTVTTLIEKSGKNAYKLLGGSQDPTVLYSNWALNQNYGIKGDGVGLSRFQGSPTADPTELSQFVVWVFNLSTVNATDVQAICDIEYDTTWSEVADVTSS